MKKWKMEQAKREHTNQTRSAFFSLADIWVCVCVWYMVSVIILSNWPDHLFVFIHRHAHTHTQSVRLVWFRAGLFINFIFRSWLLTVNTSFCCQLRRFICVRILLEFLGDSFSFLSDLWVCACCFCLSLFMLSARLLAIFLFVFYLTLECYPKIVLMLPFTCFLRLRSMMLIIVRVWVLLRLKNLLEYKSDIPTQIA